MFGWGALFRWDVLAVVVPGGFIAVGLAMLGVDWFPHNLLISQACFGVAALLFVTKAIGHAIESTGRILSKILFCVVVNGIILAVATLAIMSVQSHKPRIIPYLSIKSYISPGYKSGETIHGIPWRDEFQAVRLSIGNISGVPISNLDVTVSVLPNSKDILFGMAQTDDTTKCDFFTPRWPDMPLAARGRSECL
jgi:hypothetical protein